MKIKLQDNCGRRTALLLARWTICKRGPSARPRYFTIGRDKLGELAGWRPVKRENVQVSRPRGRMHKACIQGSSCLVDS